MADKKQKVVSLLPRIVAKGSYAKTQQSPDTVLKMVGELDDVIRKYAGTLPASEMLVALRLSTREILATCVREFDESVLEVILADADVIEQHYNMQGEDDSDS
jgi:hypothetical protein